MELELFLIDAFAFLSSGNVTWGETLIMVPQFLSKTEKYVIASKVGNLVIKLSNFKLL